jgi:hypothetical protein
MFVHPDRNVAVFLALASLALALGLASCAGAKAAVNAEPAVQAASSPTAPADTEAAKSSAASRAPAKKSSAEGLRGEELEGPSIEFVTSDAAVESAARDKPRSETGASAPQSGLRAGFSDDNEQFNYFTKFLEEYDSVPHYGLAIGERIVLRVLDSAGRGVANAEVTVSSGGAVLGSGKTYSDGSYFLYPLELGAKDAASYSVEARSGGLSASVELARSGPRSVAIALGGPRAVPAPLPVDVLFVLDTTGSMGEEIERLRSTIDIIAANVTALKPKPALRFGMVLYRDRDDAYDTRMVPFTPDLEAFRAALDEVDADGGGDEPEDLQSALRDAVRNMQWAPGGIRLGFIVTDASAHLDYGQGYDYATISREAKAKGIKLFSIGAGGLPLEGEYVLRQIAQYTQGKYIFLSYGEKGEAEGGKEGSVSHHTGSNFTTDKLEAIVIRFVREEIARQSDRPLEAEEPYDSARKVDGESREATLGKLFAQALGELSDYSSLRLESGAKLAVMPLAAAEGSGADAPAQAEYFGSQLALAASASKAFTVVERGNLQSVLGELELQLSGLADEDNAAMAGKLLGADLLVTGTVFRAKDRYEIFLKLVRVETAEILAATKARVDLKLGL